MTFDFFSFWESIQYMFLSESENLLRKNRYYTVKPNQTWALPHDPIVDKYCTPVVATVMVVNTKNKTLSYKTNYSNGECTQCSIEKFKSEFELQC